MRSLYKISTDVSDVLAHLMDAETEEDVQKLEAELEELDNQLHVKAVSCIGYARQLESLADAIKARKAEFDGREKAYRNRAKWLKDYVLAAMKSADMDKIEDTEMVLTIRKNPQSVKLIEGYEVPEKFWVHQTTSKVDKNLVKDALKAGEVIPGAELIQTERLGVK